MVVCYKVVGTGIVVYRNFDFVGILVCGDMVGLSLVGITCAVEGCEIFHSVVELGVGGFGWLRCSVDK